MPTYAELVDADPTAWLHQARAWDDLARELTARADEVRTAYARLDGTWSGADARAAWVRRDELLSELGRAAGHASATADVLGRHAGTVMAAQQRVRTAVLGANPLVVRVEPDGTVLPGTGVAGTLPGVVPNMGLYVVTARRISEEIARALADAARSDAETVAALHRLGPCPEPPGGPEAGSRAHGATWFADAAGPPSRSVTGPSRDHHLGDN